MAKKQVATNVAKLIINEEHDKPFDMTSPDKKTTAEECLGEADKNAPNSIKKDK